MSRIFVNFCDTNVLLIFKATDLESAGFRRKQGKTRAYRKKCLFFRCYNKKDGYIHPEISQENRADGFSADIKGVLL